ncbi:MAG: amino acid ABC transporter substrate-binding protein [Candidatus Cloacimonadota bacterium]|nr:MAG: amino acid ABC transporter substrate-binding protein [Candidatus Cloacimonadota bacterium]PIE77710.1 MAG: amino acid ABC transporter substrate-binding protein [Candidatus Delongbacteria bacterium]
MRNLFLNLIVLISITISTSLFGADKKFKKAPLVVGMELQYPPFEMSDGDGNPTGVSVEIAKALGNFLGREVKIENIAWTGLIPSLQSGKVDLVISSMNITDKRKKVVDFSDPYAQSGLTLLINKDSKVTGWENIDQKGNVVAVKSGTTGAILAKKELKKAEVRYFDEPAACVMEVSQGKADAYIYDPLTVYNNHKKHRATTRVNLKNIPNTAGAWGMAIKKGNDKLKSKVNKFIKSFRKSGGFEKLEKKYLGELKAEFDKNKIPSFFDL